MNQGRSHAYFPWCVSTENTPTSAHRQRIQADQRISTRARHFRTASAQQLREPENACMLQQTRLHQQARTSCRNPPQETSKCRQKEGDKGRPCAFLSDVF